jgi:ankyrin repeat protein
MEGVLSSLILTDTGALLRKKKTPQIAVRTPQMTQVGVKKGEVASDTELEHQHVSIATHEKHHETIKPNAPPEKMRIAQTDPRRLDLLRIPTEMLQGISDGAGPINWNITLSQQLKEAAEAVAVAILQLPGDEEAVALAAKVRQLQEEQMAWTVWRKTTLAPPQRESRPANSTSPMAAAEAHRHIMKQWAKQSSAVDETRKYLDSTYSDYLSQAFYSRAEDASPTTTSSDTADAVQKTVPNVLSPTSNVLCCAVNLTWQRALDQAIDADDVPAMARAVRKGATVSTPRDYDRCPGVYCTPLHRAAMQGHRAAVEWLVSRGADPTVANKEGANPLHLAAANGSVPVVQLLLAQGSAMSAVDGGNATALHYAAGAGREAVVKLLVGQGADLAVKQNNGCTALHLAIRQGQAAVAEMLVLHGADPLALDDENASPLHYAARGGQHSVAELLLARGADVGGVDNENATSIHYAAAAGNLSVIEFLMMQSDSDALLILATKHGCTPLHLSVQAGHVETAEW